MFKNQKRSKKTYSQEFKMACALLVILRMSFFYVSKKINIYFFITLVGFALIANPINIQAKENISKPFEGKWEECFTVNGDSSYSGDEICGGYYLLERGKNICGIWKYFASGVYEGRLQAVMVSKNKAKVINICGTKGDYTKTACISQGYENMDSKNGWELPRGYLTSLQICKVGLVDSNHPCGYYKKSEGIKKQILSELELKDILSEPWVSSCLAGKDLKDSNLYGKH